MTIEENFGPDTLQGPSKKNTKAEYGINENPEKGRCRLTINGHPCRAKKAARGLCQSHYWRFKQDGTVDIWGAEKQR